MKRLPLLLAVLLVTVSARAAVPPAPQLFPEDTLVLLSVPDWDGGGKSWDRTPFAQLWADPAMKPFREKFETKWKSQVAGPIENDLGLKLSELSPLIHGQCSLALLKPVPTTTPQVTAEPRWLMIADTGESASKASELLASLKKRWIDAGKEQKSESVRGVEFTTYLWKPTNAAPADASTPANDLDAVLPKGDDKESVSLAMSGPLMLIAGKPSDFEKLLVRLQGGSVTPLGESGAFQREAAGRIQGAAAWAWVDVKHFINLALKSATEGGGEAANPFAPQPDKIFAALGIDAITSALVTVKLADAGTYSEFFIGAPGENRRGILKLLNWEPRDSAPPSFVAADTVKFSRSRLDLRAAWASLEALINEVSPPMGAFLKMGIENAGKDRDPNFDLRQALIANLGDDLITIEKPPRSASLDDQQNAPALYLLGGGQPDTLISGVRAMMGLLPPPMNEVGERDFLGRKVYAAKLAPRTTADGRRVERQLHFARAGSYAAMSTDVGLLEEFLRSSESTERGLAQLPGLRDAADKIGGTGTGWFTFENQREKARAFFTLVKANPEAAAQMLNAQGQTAALAGLGTPGTAPGEAVKEWFDFALLPEFNAVSRYFHLQVGTVATLSEGITIRSYLPAPPELAR